MKKGMHVECPYQLVGTFDGDTYIERDADVKLQRAIAANQSFPYFCAPRQSGKSSLIMHTINFFATLPDNTRCECLLVDLSVLLGDYGKYKDADELLYAVMVDISVRMGFERDKITCDYPEDTFLSWLSGSKQRLVVFLDELDALIHANKTINPNYSADFLQKLRALFNKRSDRRYRNALTKVQFVLAGAAHPLYLAPDRSRSPFNIGDEIPLLDLNLEQVHTLCSHLDKISVKFSDQTVKSIYLETSGVLYLTRRILRDAWESMLNKADSERVLTSQDISQIVRTICSEAHTDIHFQDIYRTFSANERLRTFLKMHHNGKLRNADHLTELLLAGLSSRDTVYRCNIYKTVFGARGHLPILSRRATFSITEHPALALGLVGSFGLAIYFAGLYPYTYHGTPELDMTSNPVCDLREPLIADAHIIEAFDMSSPLDLASDEIPDLARSRPDLGALQLPRPAFPPDRRIVPDRSCIRGTMVTPEAAQAIALVLAKLRVRMRPGDMLVLYRYPGTQELIVSEKPGYLRGEVESELIVNINDRILAIGAQMPKEVRIRCAR